MWDLETEKEHWVTKEIWKEVRTFIKVTNISWDKCPILTRDANNRRKLGYRVYDNSVWSCQFFCKSKTISKVKNSLKKKKRKQPSPEVLESIKKFSQYLRRESIGAFVKMQILRPHARTLKSEWALARRPESAFTDRPGDFLCTWTFPSLRTHQQPPTRPLPAGNSPHPLRPLPSEGKTVREYQLILAWPDIRKKRL